jgi:hypothetical protein
VSGGPLSDVVVAVELRSTKEVSKRVVDTRSMASPDVQIVA